MAKQMTELTTDFDIVGPVVSVEPPGPVVPVRRDGRTRYLQDGRWLPGWLVWLRRRKRVALALVVMGVGAYALARLLLAGRLIGGAK